MDKKFDFDQIKSAMEKMLSKCGGCSEVDGGIFSFFQQNKPKSYDVKLLPKFKIDEDRSESTGN